MDLEGYLRVAVTGLLCDHDCQLGSDDLEVEEALDTIIDECIMGIASQYVAGLGIDGIRALVPEYKG